MSDENWSHLVVGHIFRFADALGDLDILIACEKIQRTENSEIVALINYYLR